VPTQKRERKEAHKTMAETKNALPIWSTGSTKSTSALQPCSAISNANEASFLLEHIVMAVRPYFNTKETKKKRERLGGREGRRRRRRINVAN
jgi:hypothetical protein